MDSESKKFFAGSLQKEDNYQAYIPNKINQDLVIKDKRVYKLLEETSYTLGELNTLSLNTAFYNTFTNMHVLLEAFSSSEIEGTQVEIKDVLDDNADDSNSTRASEKRKEDGNDVKKIRNLCKTTHYFLNSKKSIKYNTKTIESMNAKLFSGIKTKTNTLGKIRDIQNFIGGKSILDALFIPPPPKYVKTLLEDLNLFWYNEDFFIPSLIKIAIYHFQFETIHAFTDGNGRIGRLLINLQLKDSGFLDLPVLCLSNYWKVNKGRYYDALSICRFSHDIEYWIRFFLMSINEAAKERIITIKNIFALKEKYIKEIEKTYRNSDLYIAFLEYLLTNRHFISVKNVQEELKVTYQGANKMIDNFISIGILKQIKNNKRNREFVFKEYDNLIFKLIEKE